nr:hypothetical protein [Tanacetum cinerariifolium]
FFIISSIAVQTPDNGISNLLAVGTTFTGSRNLYSQWELSPGSGNALCILFPTLAARLRVKWVPRSLMITFGVPNQEKRDFKNLKTTLASLVGSALTSTHYER